MFKLFKRLYKSVRVGLLLEAAWSSVAKGDIHEAETLFLNAKTYLKILSAEHEIMYAYMKFKGSSYYDAAVSFDLAWKKVDLEENLTLSEKTYFKAYILGPSMVSLGFVKRDNPKFYYTNIHDININEIDLNQVHKKWKVHFAIRDRTLNM